MESGLGAVAPNNHNVCGRWKFNRLFIKKNNEPACNQPGLDLDNYLYFIGNNNMAAHGAFNKYSFGPVSFFQQLYKKAG